jgi:hypothetical protein
MKTQKRKRRMYKKKGGMNAVRNSIGRVHSSARRLYREKIKPGAQRLFTEKIKPGARMVADEYLISTPIGRTARGVANWTPEVLDKIPKMDEFVRKGFNAAGSISKHIDIDNLFNDQQMEKEFKMLRFDPKLFVPFIESFAFKKETPGPFLGPRALHKIRKEPYNIDDRPEKYIFAGLGGAPEHRLTDIVGLELDTRNYIHKPENHWVYGAKTRQTGGSRRAGRKVSMPIVSDQVQRSMLVYLLRI